MHPFEKFYQKYSKMVIPPAVCLRIVSNWQRHAPMIDVAVGKRSLRPSLFNVTSAMKPELDTYEGKSYEERESILGLALAAFTFLAYRYDKRIFCIHKALYDGLCEVEFPRDAPLETLIFSETYSAVLILPDSVYYNWVVATVENGVDSVEGKPARILQLNAMGYAPNSISFYCNSIFSAVIEPGATIQSAIDYMDKVNQRSFGEEKAPLYAEKCNGKALNGLLATLAYIKADRDVVAQVHPGRKKFKGWSLRALAQSSDFIPEQFAVGNGYAKIIENYEDGIEAGPEGSGGRAVRPHIRRPHAHLYHTKQGPIIHFLPPISVKGADMASFDPERPMKILVK